MHEERKGRRGVHGKGRVGGIGRVGLRWDEQGQE